MTRFKRTSFICSTCRRELPRAAFDPRIRNGKLDGLKATCHECIDRNSPRRIHPPMTPPNPSGFCMCGCGGITAISKKTSRTEFRMAGEHMRFINGHSNRKAGVEYIEEDRGFITPCWIWQRNKNGGGYGQLQVNGTPMVAHRHFYERCHGSIPEGLNLDHLCRVRSCVNPDHLEPITGTENTRRGINVKLTPALVVEIKRLSAAGWKPTPIARALGTPLGATKGVIHGETWKDVAA